MIFRSLPNPWQASDHLPNESQTQIFPKGEKFMRSTSCGSVALQGAERAIDACCFFSLILTWQ